jgi:putative membrane protein
MKALKSSSLAILFVASVVGAACGGSDQQTPPNTQAGAGQAANPQYGSTMSQPAPAPDPPTTPAPTGGQGPGKTMESANTTGSISESNPGDASNAANLQTSQLGSPPADTVGTTPPQSGASSFHDADIAAVLGTVNQGEVDEAQLAIGKSKSADVRKFAQHMAADHRDMIRKDKALLSRIHVTPSDNVVSNQLKSDGRGELAALQGDTGRDFDRAYMDAQVKGHHHALELIDQMLPNMQNGDFKTAIQGARAKVEHHLQEAERIQQTVEQGSANKQTGK